MNTINYLFSENDREIYLSVFAYKGVKLGALVCKSESFPGFGMLCPCCVSLETRLKCVEVIRKAITKEEIDKGYFFGSGWAEGFEKDKDIFYWPSGEYAYQSVNDSITEILN